jgi:hypothetical protein
MALNYGYPGQYSTYVPNAEASQSLIVGYARNPKSFVLPDYTQIIQAKNNFGLYTRWLSQEAARIISSNDGESVWADGDAAPEGTRNTEATTRLPFITVRRVYPVTLGDMAIAQADFSILAANAGSSGQRCMTSRTMRTMNNLVAASWGTNTAAVDGGILAGGQNWLTGSTGIGGAQGPNIKLSFQFASKKINLNTYGVVDPSQNVLVCNPGTAQGMAASVEIQDYIKQSPFALAQLRGDSPSQNGMWGLADMLYGIGIKVEKTVRVTTRQNFTGVATSVYVCPDHAAFFLARDGDLVGIEGARNFSTVQIFIYQDEMTYEQMNDVNNKRTTARVIGDDDPHVVASESGFYFTAVDN